MQDLFEGHPWRVLGLMLLGVGFAGLAAFITEVVFQ